VSPSLLTFMAGRRDPCGVDPAPEARDGASGKCVAFLIVWHTYFDPDEDRWVRIIGFRKAERRECRAYEQGA